MNSLFENEISPFPTAYAEILQRIRQVQPIKYGKTRNFLNGAVTYLSPYISRGVISTKQVFDYMQYETPYSLSSMEKFIQELAWRDYWQQLWKAKGDLINEDLKNTQEPVLNTGISAAVVSANTGIEAIDKGIQKLYDSGYMHNHLRMYTAAICCNMAYSHWKAPARWMYYHLLDGDWASNALSWQWVAGANSNKKYYANQGNINRYCFTDQQGTFLEVEYADFPDMPVPEVLQETSRLELETPLPKSQPLDMNPNQPVYLYNYYNLDPQWGESVQANRVLLLEPDHFKAYPISQKSVDFMLGLTENIPDIQIFVGSFQELQNSCPQMEFHFKEHPLNNHYKGQEHPRDWMFTVEGYYRSFFAFWKKGQKEQKRLMAKHVNNPR